MAQEDGRLIRPRLSICLFVLLLSQMRLRGVIMSNMLWTLLVVFLWRRYYYYYYHYYYYYYYHYHYYYYYYYYYDNSHY